MTPRSATPVAVGAELKPAAVAFAFPGNRDALRLRDPVTDQLLATPEWVAGGQNSPGAYVRGTRPTIQVRFSGPRGQRLRTRIGARAERGPAIAPREVELLFDADGRSAPVELQLAAALPDAIGRVLLRWHWYRQDGARATPLGSSDHELLLSWAPLTDPAEWAAHPPPPDPPDQPRLRWTYLPLLRWTCEWAAKQDDPKAICDAIISQLWKSGLQYGVAAWGVRQMLSAGGGYCGGWYRMFQALAGTQGVDVERRSYLVDWPAGSTTNEKADARWCAIVVRHSGLNRTEPAEGPAAYHDADRAPLTACAVEECRQRRYRFWGQPGRIADGHCVNFLRHDGRWYLYDASFFDHPVALSDFTLPRGDSSTPVDVREQGDFLSAYLAQAVDFMLGSLVNRGERYATVHPAPGTRGAETRNGLTVKTPVVFGSGDTIRFYWST
jgi:hypothetical protein